MRLLLFAALFPALALAQTRPSEDDMFGSDSPTVEDAGTPLARDESSMFGDDVPDAGDIAAPTPGDDRDVAQLSSGPVQSKFDTSEIVSDPLKIGGNLLMFGQGYFQEGRPFLEGSFSAPMILDMYIDGRPNDRLRAYAVGRLQFDPTRPVGTGNSTAPAGTGTSLVGLTPATAANPSVFLDQLWLRFDILRTVYLTIGRQKVRWGVSRIWYPTDFLNSQPRDAFNPFDVRLGVNMIKAHVPIESLGWNFYAYGLLDAVNVTSTGVQLKQLGGAVRGEFVLGPAEIGLGGVWQDGRRPRYAVDVSTALGPFDVYAEAAFRDARDFVRYDYPAELTPQNLVQNGIEGTITSRRDEGVIVQVSGGASFQFNYTDKNMAVISAEYFYNPAGYEKPIGYLVQTFAPQFTGDQLDPIQRTPLYQGKHNVGLTIAAPGIPGADWITVSLSNVVIISDPAALTRLDVIFRVLNFLSVQAFGSVFYGQTGGQLRFNLEPKTISDVANLSEFANPGSGDVVRSQLRPLQYPPLVQAGVLLRLSI
ncbi:MAG: hypothetical protein ACO1OB_07120 [Archangium sp.]